MFDKAEDVVANVVKLDRRDPLELRKLLDELRTGGLPIVDLLADFGKRGPNDEGRMTND
jgi:hypothetical protein